jgi:hypothetical protein
VDFEALLAGARGRPGRHPYDSAPAAPDDSHFCCHT